MSSSAPATPIDYGDNGELGAESNFALAELAIQAKREMHWWVGRTTSPPRRRRAEDVSQDGRAGKRGQAGGGANRRSPRLPDCTMMPDLSIRFEGVLALAA